MNRDEQDAAREGGPIPRADYERFREALDALFGQLQVSRERFLQVERAIEQVASAMAAVAPEEQERPIARAPITNDEALRAATATRPWLSEHRITTSRRRDATEIRYLAWLAQQLSGQNYSEIGRQWGGRDHTTVIYGCRRAVEELRRGTTSMDWTALLQRLGREDLRDLWRAFLDDAPAQGGDDA